MDQTTAELPLEEIITFGGAVPWPDLNVSTTNLFYLIDHRAAITVWHLMFVGVGFSGLSITPQLSDQRR